MINQMKTQVWIIISK